MLHETQNNPMISPAPSEENSPYRQLRVAEVIEETADARSIVLDQPGIGSEFAYKPGQFLTLRIPSPDGAIARCYSLASAPGVDGKMKITVKRVQGGVVSNWLCDAVQPGDLLYAMPPAGLFTPTRLDAGLLLLAGGSGITPMMSIIKAALREGSQRIVLVYANRNEQSVIFRGELDRLARAHPGRLIVYHWLESVQGLPGREQLAGIVEPYTDYEALLCGPDAFMNCGVEALAGLGVDRHRIKVEKFVSLTGDPGRHHVPEPDTALGPASDLAVELDGETHAMTWPSNQFLLDVLLGQGLAAPFSCREGKCGACACKVVEGEVAMDEDAVLGAEEIAEGWILSCQARPASAKVRITFDQP